MLSGTARRRPGGMAPSIASGGTRSSLRVSGGSGRLLILAVRAATRSTDWISDTKCSVVTTRRCFGFLLGVLLGVAYVRGLDVPQKSHQIDIRAKGTGKASIIFGIGSVYTYIGHCLPLLGVLYTPPRQYNVISPPQMGG